MNQYQIPEIITDDFIKEFFFKGEKTQSGRVNNKFISRFPQLREYINNRFNDSSCLSETLWRIYYGIEKAPLCPVCGKKCTWAGRNKFNGHCSFECSCKDENVNAQRSSTRRNKTSEEKEIIKNKVKATCRIRYGVDSYSQTNECKEKLRKTFLERYGVESIFQSKDIREKIKQKNLKNLGVEWPGQNPKCIEKGRQTCMERYGVDHNFKIPEVIEKRNETWNKKYGGNPFSNKDIREKGYNTAIQKYGNCNNYEKIKQTCLERYGVEYVFQSDNFKLHAQQVMLEKYGNTCYPMSPVYKHFLLENYGVEYYTQTNEYQIKVYNTKKKNHTFNTSKIEQQFKEYLEQNYPNDFKYQYRSDLYPYNCDFYINSLDLYIEIQGTWQHGEHPFNENNQDDINKLNLWKTKNEKFIENGKPNNLYKDAIIRWTIKDVEKRNIAKENNLNYLEIFSTDINVVINKLNNYILYGN